MSPPDLPAKLRAALPVLIFIVFLCGLIASISAQVRPQKNFPRASKGFMYCSNIDNRSPVLLRGEWEYYPGRVLFPSDFAHSGDALDGSKPEYVQVPGSTPNAFGFGTYRLSFRAVTSADAFAIKTTDVWSSARIYLDGKLICSIGDPSTLSNASLPWNSSLYITFDMDTFRTNHELIVQTSNYDFYRQGIANPIHFGTQPEVYELCNNVRLSESICAMSVLILSVLLICLLTLHIQFGSIRYLLLFSCAFELYLLATGEKLLLNLFPETPYRLFIRLYLVSYPLMGLFMALYVCPFAESGRLWRVLRNALIVLTAAVIGLIAFSPQRIQAYLVAAVFLLGAAEALLSLGFLLVQLWRHGMGALFQILAFLNWLTIYAVSFLYGKGLLGTSARTFCLAFSVIGFVVLQLIYVAQRVANIYSGNERLAQRMVMSDRIKSDLMAIVSHELRTPLHGIINITQSTIDALRTQSGVDSTPQTDELSLAITLARHMSGVVSDLYTFVCEDEYDSLDLRPTSLRVETNAVLEMFGYTQTNSAVHLVNRIKPDASTVYADEDKLWQVLTNLVSNALKYTRSGTITVSSRRDGAYVQVLVSDTGIGMPPEQQAQIFERYTRLPSGEAVAPGAGLGLYIVRKLVEEMKGDIRVEWSEPGKGSCILFRLPACDEAPDDSRHKALSRPVAQPESEQFLPTRPASGRVLVADDNPVNLRVVKTIFSDCKFEIDTVESGQQAVDRVRTAGTKDGYDIVILDVMMPGMSGFEACRLIRAQYSHAELPVLMLTARNQTRDIVTGFWAGANDYVSKPADALELRARVFTLIKLRQTAREAAQNEMLYLQAQIKPHFLYNAINTISAIALTNGVAASELIDDLGVYLRSSFKNHMPDEIVPLARELDLVQAYLNIQKARFGKRLAVEMDIQSSLNDPIPALILQPLVENAVRHGSFGKSDGIAVRIETRVEGEDLVIRVSDNGVGMDTNQQKEILCDPDDAHPGVGIFNVNRRLRLRYNRSLAFESAPGMGTRVTIRIPLQKADPPEENKDCPDSE